MTKVPHSVIIGKVAHEDGLLADLAGLLVDEPDRHRERCLIGLVLLAALLDGELRLAELVIAELDRERAGVVLDRRDVVNGFAETFADEPGEGFTLDIDQVGEVKNVLQAGKRLARARRSNRLGQGEQPPLSAMDEGERSGAGVRERCRELCRRTKQDSERDPPAASCDERPSCAPTDLA